MAFEAVFEGIMGLLRNDPQLVPGILGPRTVQNQRLYRPYPSIYNSLSTYEPNQPSEGWLVVEEPVPSRFFSQRGFATNHQFFDILFHCYATTYALAHQVQDVLDGMFHWELQQQRDLQWGERIILFARRYSEVDKYMESIKLAQKDITYYFETVLETSPA
jgi:hypothetical protein